VRRAEPRSRWLLPLLLGIAAATGLFPAGVPAQPAEIRPLEIREASDVGGLEAQSAALILSGQQGGDLAASILVVPLPGAAPDTVRLALVVDLAGTSLLASGADADRGETAGGATRAPEGSEETGGESDGGNDGETGETPGGSPPTLVTEVHAYAVGPENRLAAYFTQAFALSRRELAERDGWAGVRFFGVLDVPPGEWSVRLLVRQRESGRLALRAVRVTAPDFGSSSPAEPVLLPPLVPEPSDRWTLVRQSGSAGEEGTFPLDLEDALPGGGRWVPSTRPVVEPGGRTIYLLGRDLGRAPDRSADDRGDPSREDRSEGGAERTVDRGPGWTAQAYEPGTGPEDPGSPEPESAGRPTGGRERTAVRVEVSRTGGLRLGGLELDLLEATLDPEGLRPGAGTLVLTGPSGATASLPAVVIPPEMDLAAAYPDKPPGAPLWVDLMSLRQTPVPVPAPVPETAEDAEVGDEELARFQIAYLGALEHLADGDRSAALEGVLAAERSGLAGGAGVEALARGQLQVALDVSRGAAEGLLPWIGLHEELYAEYRRRGDATLAAHARRVTLGLIDLYVRLGEREDRGRVAAAALIGVAEQLLAYGNTLETLGILELALERDPDQPAALLLLAAIHELLGEPREVVSLLRRLEAVTPAGDPVGAEGRLRLGINLRRLGSTEEAAELLEGCVAPDRPRWVRAVAYEELAALRVDEGRPEEAVRLLEQAVKRMPRQQRLYIQLAAVHESLGRPAKARAVLAELEDRVRRRAGRDRDSPRMRYCEWSEEALDRSRELFRRAAGARMPVLAAALTRFLARGGQV
jgi:tetratricopeptide (TPR) repeat protein